MSIIHMGYVNIFPFLYMYISHIICCFYFPNNRICVSQHCNLFSKHYKFFPPIVVFPKHFNLFFMHHQCNSHHNNSSTIIFFTCISQSSDNSTVQNISLFLYMWSCKFWIIMSSLECFKGTPTLYNYQLPSYLVMHNCIPERNHANSIYIIIACLTPMISFFIQNILGYL